MALCLDQGQRKIYSVDIKECEGENDCDSNADCVERIGSYDCVCHSGFQGDGRSCGGW